MRWEEVHSPGARADGRSGLAGDDWRRFVNRRGRQDALHAVDQAVLDSLLQSIILDELFHDTAEQIIITWQNGTNKKVIQTNGQQKGKT